MVKCGPTNLWLSYTILCTFASCSDGSISIDPPTDRQPYKHFFKTTITKAVTKASLWKKNFSDLRAQYGYSSIGCSCLTAVTILYTLKNLHIFLVDDQQDDTKKIVFWLLFFGTAGSFMYYILFGDSPKATSPQEPPSNTNLRPLNTVTLDPCCLKKEKPSVKAQEVSLADGTGEFEEKFAGLRNPGCYCYMNAALQFLWSVPEIMACCEKLEDGTVGHYLYQLHENILKEKKDRLTRQKPPEGNPQSQEDSSSSADQKTQTIAPQTKPLPHQNLDPDPSVQQTELLPDQKLRGQEKEQNSVPVDQPSDSKPIGYFSQLTQAKLDKQKQEEEKVQSKAREEWDKAWKKVSPEAKDFHRLLFHALFSNTTSAAYEWHYKRKVPQNPIIEVITDMEEITEENSIYKGNFPKNTKEDQTAVTPCSSTVPNQQPRFKFFKKDIFSNEEQSSKRSVQSKAIEGTQEDAQGCLQHMVEKIEEEIKKHNENLQANNPKYISSPFSELISEHYQARFDDGQGQQVDFQSFEGFEGTGEGFEGTGQTKNTDQCTIPIHNFHVPQDQSFSECLALWKHQDVSQTLEKDPNFFDPRVVERISGTSSENLKEAIGPDTEAWNQIAHKTVHRNFFKDKAPKTLLLGKSDGNGYRNASGDSFHCFPSQIKMPYKEEQTDQMKEASYTLKSMICRTAARNNSSGHYVTYVRHNDNQWIRLNDSAITLLNVTGNFDQSNWLAGEAPYTAYYERDE